MSITLALRHRYHYDARFHALVSEFAAALEQRRATVADLQDALTVATEIQKDRTARYSAEGMSEAATAARLAERLKEFVETPATRRQWYPDGYPTAAPTGTNRHHDDVGNARASREPSDENPQKKA